MVARLHQRSRVGHRDSGRTTGPGRATQSEWIYSQGLYFEANVGGEIKDSRVL